MRILAEKWKTVEHLAFGPGSRLAVAYSSGFVVWDAGTGEQVERFRFSSESPSILSAAAILFPPDGRCVYLASTHNGLSEFCLPGLKRKPIDQPGPIYLYSAAMSPDGRRLVCHATWSGDWRGRTSIFPIDRGLIGYERGADGRAEFAWHESVGRNYVPGLSFLPGGDRFATAEYGEAPMTRGLRVPLVTIRAWPGGRLLSWSRAPRISGYEGVAVSPDGRRIACRAKTHLHVWPASLASEVCSAANDNRRHFTGLAFHPSGKYLAATSNDHTVKLYDTATLAVARTYTWGVGKLKTVAFSADGSLAAAANDSGRVVVWDVDL